MQSQQNTAIHFKISFDSQLRRASLSRLTYPNLEALIRYLFSLPVETLSIKYKDEEDDLITLSSEIEFATMLASFPPNHLFRLTVTLAPSPPSVSIQNTPIFSPILPSRCQRMRRICKTMKPENSEHAQPCHFFTHHFPPGQKFPKSCTDDGFNAVFDPEHVILPSVASSSQPVSVTITNTGTHTWPVGTSLIRVGRWKRGEKVIFSESVAPGASYPLTMTVFVLHGFHISKWRVVLPDGRKFGAKLWVKTQNFFRGPRCNPELKERICEGAMKLREMGFKGRQVWCLLKQYDADVERVVAELLPNQCTEKA